MPLARHPGRRSSILAGLPRRTPGFPHLRRVPASGGVQLGNLPVIRDPTAETPVVR